MSEGKTSDFDLSDLWFTFQGFLFGYKHILLGVAAVPI